MLKQNHISFHCKHLEVHFTGVKKSEWAGRLWKQQQVQRLLSGCLAQVMIGSAELPDVKTASGVRTVLQVVISHVATWQQFQLQNVSWINRCIAALLMKGLKSSAAGRTYREAPPTSTATPRLNLHSFPKLSIRSDRYTVCLLGLGLNSFLSPVAQWHSQSCDQTDQ